MIRAKDQVLRHRYWKGYQVGERFIRCSARRAAVRKSSILRCTIVFGDWVHAGFGWWAVDGRLELEDVSG